MSKWKEWDIQVDDKP